MNRSILFVSFHYPPVQASSGLLRILAFTRYFAQTNWNVSVLTSDVAGVDVVGSTNRNLVPSNVRVIKTKAHDLAQTFAIGGKYPGVLEWPDRYASWAISAAMAGYKETLSEKQRWHLVNFIRSLKS